MQKRTLFLLLCVYFTITTSAQKNHSVPPAHTLRLNPLGLIDVVEPNISVGYVYRFSDNWAIGSDLAWVFYSRYFEQTKHADGFIFRPAIRKYIGRRKQSFFDAELHYKYVVSTIEDWLGRDCVNGVAAYEEFTTFHYLRQSIGTNLKFGEELSLSRNNKFWLEYYLGLGFRWNFQKVLNETNCCYIYATNPVGIQKDDGHFTFAVPFGLRLLYKLK